MTRHNSVFAVPSSRASVAFFSSFAVLLGANSALAQETNFDIERFKPAVTHDGFVNLEGTAVRPTDDPWEFGGFVQFGHNPLVAAEDGDVTQRLVGRRMGFDLLASVTLAEPFALGVGMPLYVLQSGDTDPSEAGLGDLRIVPKLRLVDDRESPVGLALLAEFRVPTNTGDFSGNDGFVFAPRLALDHRYVSGIRLGMNVGLALKKTKEYFNVTAGDELIYGGALGYNFGGMRGDTELGLELFGGLGLEDSDAEENPLEAFAFLKHRPSEVVELIFGPGFGIAPGYGVPTYRAFFGIRITPTSHDQDHDGIADSEDECDTQEEDWDRLQDTDGCPEDDADEDGIPDAQDKCPDEKEMINGFEDYDGCDDEGPAKVIVEEDQIRILETIKFETNEAQIKPESHSILDQVALTMKAHRKRIRRVRVEGHTDDTGEHDYNMQLSIRRAEAVRHYLIGRGIDANRLEAKGYGPDRPRESGTGDNARTTNRRVEFIVIE